MNNKGQGAMEYLMTYGWAILVVIIVGIVLWQSGVFGTGGGGVSGFTEVRVEDYVCSDGGVIVSFENAAGSTMKQTNVMISEDSFATNFTMTDIEGNASLNWAAGKEYAQNITNITCTTGEGYAFDFNIAYVAESGLAHTETGTIRGQGE